MKCELKYIAHISKSGMLTHGVWGATIITASAFGVVALAKLIHPIALLLLNIIVIVFLGFIYYDAHQVCKQKKGQRRGD